MEGHVDWQRAPEATDFERPALRRQPSEAGKRRVVITGVGVVAASGIGTGALWNLLISGRSAVRPVEGFDASEYPVGIAAQIPDFKPRDFMTAQQARHLGRYCHLALAATRLAVDDARPERPVLASTRSGLFLGTGAGPAQSWWDGCDTFSRSNFRRVSPSFPVFASPHAAASHSASEFDITGPIGTISSECPSGLDAIVAASRRIAGGEIDMAIAGAVDAPVCRILFASLAYSGMLARGNGTPASASRPFDRDRSGFVLGEGGAMIVLEDAESAMARGARIYGEVLGAGAGRDRPTYIGETDPSGQGFVHAAQQALVDADLDASRLVYVSAHAPAVKTTDLAEIRALRKLLGARRGRVPVSSIKGALGQPLAAAGVLQLITGLLTFEHGWIPPTANCDNLDPECDLDVVRSAPREVEAGPTLVTSHGFGGNTTSVVIDAFHA